MSITSWSTTPASNNSAPPNGWPEGMAPSAVNDCARQMMADIATWYAAATSTRSALNAQRATTAQSLASSTVNTLIFNSENVDIGAAFDNATGIFTAPVTGLYEFNLSASLQNNASGSWTLNGVYFSKNNATAAGASRFDCTTGGVSAGSLVNAGSNAFICGGSILVSLTAADTMRVKADIGVGGGAGNMVMNIGSTLSGVLINPG